jgi:ABC-type Fe3+ transport system, periplasmic component
MSPLRGFTAAVVVPLFLIVLSACGGGGGESGAAGAPAAPSGAGGALTIYSGRNENLVGPLIDRLKAATGLDVEVRYGDSAELAAQILEEGDGSRADLFFSQDAGALGALAKQGLLAELPRQTLDKVPAAYRAADGTWVGVSGRSRVIVYDPREVPTPPDSVLDLTDPRYRDQVGWAPANASFQSFVTAMRVLSGEDATRRWLEEMKANGAKTFPNNNAILDAVDAGEIRLGLINHYYWYEKVAEKGESAVPSRLAFLPGGDPGALVNVAGVGVLKTSANAAAAQRAVDFLLGDEAQKYFADETKEYPLVAGVPAAQGLPALDSLKGPDLDLSRLESLEQTLALLQDVGLV